MKYLYLLLFIIAMQKNFLSASWLIGLKFELHDMDLQNISVGVQASNKFMKKIYLNKAMFNLGYSNDFGIFFNVEPPDFNSDKSKSNKNNKKIMQNFVPMFLNQTYTKIKNAHAEYTNQLEWSLNLSVKKEYTEDIVDVILIQSTVMNTIRAYRQDLIKHNNVITMYLIVQHALDRLVHAKTELDTVLSSKKDSHNKVDCYALKFCDTFQRVYQQKIKKREQLLAEKIKKLEILRDTLKAYC